MTGAEVRLTQKRLELVELGALLKLRDVRHVPLLGDDFGEKRVGGLSRLADESQNIAVRLSHVVLASAPGFVAQALRDERSARSVLGVQRSHVAHEDRYFQTRDALGLRFLHQVESNSVALHAAVRRGLAPRSTP